MVCCFSVLLAAVVYCQSLRIISKVEFFRTGPSLDTCLPSLWDDVDFFLSFTEGMFVCEADVCFCDWFALPSSKLRLVTASVCVLASVSNTGLTEDLMILA